MDGADAPEPRRLTFPRTRAVVFGLAFLAWLGFLAYLVSITRNAVVLARPQIQTANLLVVAELTERDGRPEPKAKIERVLFARKPEWKAVAGQTLEIDDLPFHGPAHGWRGPGKYLLPLERVVAGELTIDAVHALPIVPGYQPSASRVDVVLGKDAGAAVKALAELTGVPESVLSAMAVSPVIPLSNVPIVLERDREQFESQLKRVGARMERLRFAESRIHLATPASIAEAERLVP